MYIFTFIFLIVINILHVQSTVCESKTCKCNYDIDNDLNGECIDCSYSHYSILASNYSLPHLVYSLDLTWSKLKKIVPSNLLKSKTLEILLLGDNELTEIATNALELPALKRLDLGYNNLRFIDEEIFRKLKRLVYLNLANNKFTTFTSVAFHPLSSLEELILDNNNIGPSLKVTKLFDRNGFGLTNKIKNISISSINLTTVPDNFLIDAYNIRKLVISGNNITDIFELPFTLEYLDISDNPIKQFSGEDFAETPALKELRLNNLQINEVPDFAFSNLKGLLRLQLERNRNLAYFSPLAFGRDVLEDPDDFMLETLSIRGSRISTLDRRLIQPFGQLIQLDLQGNPWTCDCRIVWLKNLRIPAEDYQHLRCSTPVTLYNSRIYDLDSKYFSCTIEHHMVVIVLSVTCSVIFAIIALWIFIFLPKYQYRARAMQSMYAPATPYAMLPVR